MLRLPIAAMLLLVLTACNPAPTLADNAATLTNIPTDGTNGTGPVASPSTSVASATPTPVVAPATPAAPGAGANPLIGKWKKVAGSCSIAGAEFTKDAVIGLLADGKTSTDPANFKPMGPNKIELSKKSGSDDKIMATLQGANRVVLTQERSPAETCTLERE